METKSYGETIAVKIITPSGLFYKGELPILTIQTTEGEMGILPGKSPFVTSLAVGDLYLGAKNHENHCAVAGGIMSASPTNVIIITDAVEYMKNIDLERAEKARAAAEAILKSGPPEAEMLKARLALERAINRIHVKKSGG